MMLKCFDLPLIGIAVLTAAFSCVARGVRLCADTFGISLDAVDVEAPSSGVDRGRQFSGFAEVEDCVLATVQHLAGALVADSFLDKTAFHAVHLPS